jgi:hypothetical protein
MTVPEETTTTPVDLDAIRARLEAATPAPWTVGDVNRQALIARNVNADGQHRGIGNLGKHQDAEFIAYARTDIPALLACIEQQAAEITDLTVAVEVYMEAHDNQMRRAQKLLDQQLSQEEASHLLEQTLASTEPVAVSKLRVRMEGRKNIPTPTETNDL